MRARLRALADVLVILALAAYAIPFFCDPNHDTLIECLPSCCSPANPAKYPPIQFGDYAAWFAGKSYEHLATRPGPDDAAIAPGERATRRW